jgi:hypothetical protein
MMEEKFLRMNCHLKYFSTLQRLMLVYQLSLEEECTLNSEKEIVFVMSLNFFSFYHRSSIRACPWRRSVRRYSGSQKH